jgi:adenine nucleotide transporter 17
MLSPVLPVVLCLCEFLPVGYLRYKSWLTLLHRAFTYPLITISTRAAVESKKPGHAQESLVKAVRRVIAQEGIAGLFDGIESSLLGIATTNAAFYYFFEESRAVLMRRKSVGAAKMATTLSTLESILASFIAGCVTSIVTNPM